MVPVAKNDDERVTVISDGAGEFTKAVDGSQFARGRILDWLHIAMKFRAAEQSIFSSRRIAGPDWDWIGSEIKSAKWLVWHGKVAKQFPGCRRSATNLKSSRTRNNPGCGGICGEFAEGVQLRAIPHPISRQ